MTRSTNLSLLDGFQKFRDIFRDDINLVWAEIEDNLFQLARKRFGQTMAASGLRVSSGVIRRHHRNMDTI